jgi:hypothetical protein
LDLPQFNNGKWRNFPGVDVDFWIGKDMCSDNADIALSPS